MNLVDFDMLYGHRNNPQGYAEALEYFDTFVPEMASLLKEDDILLITADHGCDPTTPGPYKRVYSDRRIREAAEGRN